MAAACCATVAVATLAVTAWQVTVRDGAGTNLETAATTITTAPPGTLQASTTTTGPRSAGAIIAVGSRTDGLAGLLERAQLSLELGRDGPGTTGTTDPASTSSASTTSTESTAEGTGSSDPEDSTGSTTDQSTTEASAGGSTTSSTTGTPGGGGERCFAPAFRDDFNRSEIGPDWGIYTTIGSHSPHAVRRAEAISLVDGKLVITAENDADGVLASGGLRHLGSQTYGRYSARVRTDADLTNATSGVILTWPISGDQPRDGENNMYETLKAPGARWPFYSFIHEPFDDRADGVSQTRFVFEADATQWQEMTMVWTPGFIEITRSGPGATQTETKRIDETAADRISDAEHFLSIQFDLFKGSFPDDRQRRMEVDWIQIERWCGG